MVVDAILNMVKRWINEKKALILEKNSKIGSIRAFFMIKSANFATFKMIDMCMMWGEKSVAMFDIGENQGVSMLLRHNGRYVKYV